MIKKLIYILVTVLTVSCYSIKSPSYTPTYFHDECSIGDTVYFYMNCCISDDVNLQFIRKKIRTTQEAVYVFGNVEYLCKKDTVDAVQENFLYTRELFKTLLVDKSQEPRKDEIFPWTKNNYMHWTALDKMLKYFK